MFSPALGATTAIWLMLAPALELESGARAALSVTSGVLALLLSPASIWSRSARAALAWIGLALALVNLVLPCSIEALASLATCGMALIMAGVAPWPVVERRSIVVPVASAPGAVTVDEEITAPSRPIRSAA